MITRKMFRAMELKNNAKQKVIDKIKEQKGGSELVEVLILIAIVLVVAVVIFLPQITTFLKGLIAKLTTYTDKLFNFAG